MNPFYPRIDWRGDGPGYAEMEFPLFPWTIAILYKLFGVHEVFGRLLSYVFAIGSLLVFFKLARYLLPSLGALAASFFFALSPVVVSISNSLQPDGVMLFWYLLAVYASIRWLDDDSDKHFWIAAAATAMTVLSKASALHVGVLFAFLIFNRRGFTALGRWRTWIFGVIALLPSLIWYRHAHHLWLTYGNSLGVSNETHWAGLDLFTDSSFVRGIIHNEILYVWMPTGIILAAIAVALRPRERATVIAAAWLGAVVIFLLLAARTTGDSWAFYYHVVAVGPCALLIGQAAEGTYRLVPRIRAKAEVRPFISRWRLLSTRFPLQARVTAWSLMLTIGVAVLFVASLLYEIRLNREMYASRNRFELMECAISFAPLVPKENLIVASGGPCVDPTGSPVAFNSSYMFYWMDRKGFNVCVENQTLPALDALAQRGARYFVAEKSALQQKPGFEASLRQRYFLLKECDAALLFALRP